MLRKMNYTLSKVTLPEVLRNKDVTVYSKQFCRLRGKVINTEKAKLEDIMKNEEINTIIHAIGGGVGSDFQIEDIAYDKIIIMTDADTDGAHIQVLLLTFFYRYMKPLIEAGKVYIALTTAL